MSSLQLAPVVWPGLAAELGFAEGARGARVRNGSVLRLAGRWLALEQRAGFDGDPLRDPLGIPGFWRVERAGTKWVWEHDLPPVVVPEAEGAAASKPVIEALVAWAEGTADGMPPATTTPPVEELDGWIPAGQRNVRAGARVAVVELVAEPERFALAIPTLVRIPDGLPPPREAWLRELCHDAQTHWRLVRFGIDDLRASVRAEVDLTGVPTRLARPLVQLALAALTSSAAWALPALALVTDLSVESRILDRSPRGRAGRSKAMSVTPRGEKSRHTKKGRIA